MEEFTELYKLNKDKIYKFFLYKTNDDYIAQELVAQTFFLAFKSLHMFKGKSTFSTWLFGISKNVFREYIRKEKKIESVPIENIENTLKYEDDSSKNIIGDNDIKILFLAIDSLDEIYKEVIMLRAVCELSNSEIAQLLEKKESYVRVIFHRGKIKLKEILSSRMVMDGNGKL
ncbi:RNA polymerase sigma factor [uncultured Clostridium sp.]|uniref:RNA polymerase sigma factor n=1 Tax=uncultured Clostridium sp. TaxID=59620 RepID=UPI00261D3CE3|nr:sigma-70 family RNA polymerase sigma factor [uncultured Clostridium sp.]